MIRSFFIKGVENMKEAEALFNDYYERFDHSLRGVYMKYAHTYRVVDYAKQIADSINLTGDDYELSCKCALFHDIARFKQWQVYNTFEDKLSFDHGDEGYNILKELNVNDEIILASTKYHNKYAVGDVDDRTLLFCNITRDADKLDIMMEQTNTCNDTELIIPEDVIESFRNKKLTYNKIESESSDVTNILRSVAFIFDINFKKSFEIIKETDIVNKKFDVIMEKFNDDIIKELKQICNEYIDERVSD